MKFNNEQWLGIVRDFLPFAGAIIMAAGWVDGVMWEMISGAIFTIASVVMSWNAYTKTELIERLEGLARKVVAILAGFSVFSADTESSILLIIGLLIQAANIIYSTSAKNKDKVVVVRSVEGAELKVYNKAA